MNHVEKAKLRSSFIQCSNCGSYLSAIHYCLSTDRIVKRRSVEIRIQALARRKYKKIWNRYADRWKNGQIVSAWSLTT